VTQTVRLPVISYAASYFKAAASANKIDKNFALICSKTENCDTNLGLGQLVLDSLSFHAGTFVQA